MEMKVTAIKSRKTVQYTEEEETRAGKIEWKL